MLFCRLLGFPSNLTVSKEYQSVKTFVSTGSTFFVVLGLGFNSLLVLSEDATSRQREQNPHEIVHSFFMPVCSIGKTITPRCRGRPDALLHEAEGRVQ